LQQRLISAGGSSPDVGALSQMLPSGINRTPAGYSEQAALEAAFAQSPNNLQYMQYLQNRGMYG